MHTEDVVQAPELLLKTWVWMVTQSDDEQIIAHAARCLLREFGSEQRVQQFIESLSH
ncbi:hypothetical protein LJ739_03380 [Aestuariibacter halophilus]|uniref:Uncharacterized protein n=1 Tax=Fluctibacter halophilus TaxID=226011 RepID=A0ABS8G428_9ALTE|nr:hypothetical protein [Aestuariibacter halophilus]MCC2615280.1 hypothetical protein [Aestuariibacter halophilus]